jgi:RNA polymerase-interacting CarD/CdnL/TRCF family regulator
MIYKTGDRVVYAKKAGTVIDVYGHDWLDVDIQELDIRLDAGMTVRVLADRVEPKGEET